MPNAIAQLALLSWPLVGIVLFRALSPGRAVLACIIGGYLLLPPSPAQFDLPLVPALDKTTIPTLTALAGLLVVLPDRGRLMPEGLAAALVFTVVLAPVLTVLGNTAPTSFGLFSLRGLGLRDAISTALDQVLAVLPLLIARASLSHAGGARDLLVALVLGGALYALPMLVEVAIGPRLNILIYGYFQHEMGQMIRNGGYRPIVFLTHALWAAFFVLTSLLAAVALIRTTRGMARFRMMTLGVGFSVLMVLCKSYAAIAYGALLAPIAALASRGFQVWIGALLAAAVIAYPVLNVTGLFPHDAMLEIATSVSEDRAQSLGYRFVNDAALLERVSEQPLVGWGGWGRNLLHHPVTGSIETVSDGQWIITLSMQGWIGFLSLFGLLALPLFRLAGLTWGADPATMPREVAALSLILGINMADLLINATLTPISWMTCGLLLGWTEARAPERHAPLVPLRTVL